MQEKIIRYVRNNNIYKDKILVLNVISLNIDINTIMNHVPQRLKSDLGAESVVWYGSYIFELLKQIYFLVTFGMLTFDEYTSEHIKYSL